MGRPKNCRIFILWFLLAAVSGFSQGSPGPELVIGGFPSIAPWAVVNRREGFPDEVTGGIIWDIADLVSQKTGIRFRFYFPPRRRMELEIEAGRLHVIPMADPAWLQDPDALSWSSVVIVDKKVFVTLGPSQISIRGSQDLKNLRLALQTGFVYPELPETLGYRRDDADTIVRNLTKMDLGRVDAVYAGEVDLGYRLKNRRGNYVVQPWTPGASSYRWATSRQSGEAGLKVIRAVEELVADGSVARVLATYR